MGVRLFTFALLLTSSIEARLLAGRSAGTQLGPAGTRVGSVGGSVLPQMSAKDDEPADYLMMDSVTLPLKRKTRRDKARKRDPHAPRIIDQPEFLLGYHP